MTNKLPLRIAICIFTVVGMAHLLRVVFGVGIAIGTYHVPMALSVIAAVAAFGMAWWLSRALGAAGGA